MGDVKYRTAYGPKERVDVFFTRPSLTKQSFRDETNINGIMAKYEKTGLIAHVNEHKGQYGDYSGAQDYHSSMNQVLAAQEAFGSLPSSIRKRFENDPGAFLAFMDDPENEGEARQLGLLPAEQPSEPSQGSPNAEPAASGDDPPLADDTAARGA